MIDSPQSAPAPDPVQDLGRSYGNLLEQPTWQAEGGEWAVEEPMPERQTEPLPPTAPPSPLRIVEALLFVGGAPLTAARAGEVVRGLTPAQFTEAIDTLNRDYRKQGRPYHIQPQG